MPVVGKMVLPLWSLSSSVSPWLNDLELIVVAQPEVQRHTGARLPLVLGIGVRQHVRGSTSTLSRFPVAELRHGSRNWDERCESFDRVERLIDVERPRAETGPVVSPRSAQLWRAGAELPGVPAQW